MINEKMPVYKLGGGCGQLIFGALGACMLALFVGIFCSLFSDVKFDLDFIIIGTILGLLSYFCLTRAFKTKSFAIYPDYIMANGKKFKWEDIDSMYFKRKDKIISIKPIRKNTPKHNRKTILLSLASALLTLLIIVTAIKVKNIKNALMLLPIFLAAFGLDTNDIGTRSVGLVTRKEFDKALEVLMFYTTKYKITLLDWDLM